MLGCLGEFKVQGSGGDTWAWGLGLSGQDCEECRIWGQEFRGSGPGILSNSVRSRALGHLTVARAHSSWAS